MKAEHPGRVTEMEQPESSKEIGREQPEERLSEGKQSSPR